MKRIERFLDVIDHILNRFVAASVVIVMVIIVCDVIGRYVFTQPIAWLYDLVAIYFMNMILYLIASETLRTRGHIALDLNVRLLPARAWAILQGLSWFAVNVVLVLACYKIGESALHSLRSGETHPGLYEWPVWVEKGIVAFGLALLICRIATRFVRFCLSGLDAGIFGVDESARENAP